MPGTLLPWLRLPVCHKYWAWALEAVSRNCWRLCAREPVLCSKRSHCSESLWAATREEPLLATTREKARVQQQMPSATNQPDKPTKASLLGEISSCLPLLWAPTALCSSLFWFGWLSCGSPSMASEPLKGRSWMWLIFSSPHAKPRVWYVVGIPQGQGSSHFTFIPSGAGWEEVLDTCCWTDKWINECLIESLSNDIKATFPTAAKSQCWENNSKPRILISRPFIPRSLECCLRRVPGITSSNWVNLGKLLPPVPGCLHLLKRGNSYIFLMGLLWGWNLTVCAKHWARPLDTHEMLVLQVYTWLFILKQFQIYRKFAKIVQRIPVCPSFRFLKC